MKSGAWPSRLITLLGGIVAGFLLVELWFRISPPRPAGQIVREWNLHLRHEVPVWGHERRWDLDCVRAHPERHRVMFFGNSIVYGDQVSDDEAFSRQLENRLNADYPKPGFCVMNFAQPGFGFVQNAAFAEDVIPQYKPDLVFWLSWNDEEADYVMLGSSAYRIPTWSLGPDNFPAIPLVPRPVNRFLFLHSRFYEAASLWWATRLSQFSDEQRARLEVRMAERLRKMIALVRSHGGRLAMLQTPPLDRPFNAGERDVTGLVREAQDEHARVVFLKEALVDQDFMALRLDPCCHFNPAGHREIARVLEPIVLSEIEQAKPGTSGTPAH